MWPGVEVGTVTLISGEGPLVVGKGPVRTGVTAILPRGRAKAPYSLCRRLLFAQRQWRDDRSCVDRGVGRIADADHHHQHAFLRRHPRCDDPLAGVSEELGTGQDWGLPVAAETYDGDLNDINGFHVTAEHAIAALDGARGGPVEMGSVGGGTGMICYDFKGGNGTASRVVEIGGATYTLGVFVQANFGRREQFTVLGVPVGRHIGA